MRNIKSPHTLRRSQGYTLLELIVVMAMIGILSAIAMPSFNDAISRNARDSAVMDLLSAISLARTEAVTQGLNVSLCRSINQTNCTQVEGADWADGWIIFSDTSTSGTVDGTDAILQVHGPVNDGIVAVEMSDNSNSDITDEFLQFDTDGFLNNSTNAAQFKFCDPDNIAANARAIWISNTGRASLSIDDADGVHNALDGNNLSCP